MRAFVLRWRLVELIAGLGALALLPRARTLLPAKYFYDGDYIAALNAGTTGIRPDPYYRAIAGFYARLGLDDHPRLTAVLQLALVVAAVGLALRPAARWSTIGRTTSRTTASLESRCACRRGPRPRPSWPPARCCSTAPCSARTGS
ncbi:hypothetical protein ABT369_35140 [Dactylosporangium sp. NPDC000244]|uniref:hypothetical protein n=1 Tax=Dactylosporangium sp. NPDC000244 TaxID=3154365 RepID=UPI0033237D52